MGQEFAASSPFQFFTDHTPELGKLVTEGRRKEFRAFSHFADEQTRDHIPDPQAESTFFRSKLPLAEAATLPGSEIQALYQRLLDLRRTDPVLRDQARERMEARALTRDVLAVRRWRAPQQRLLLVNFGATDARVDEFGGGWSILLDSGNPAQPDAAGVTLAARSATVLGRDRA
jgi:maltooligosyltrehalose trehalohydrolase